MFKQVIADNRHDIMKYPCRHVLSATVRSTQYTGTFKSVVDLLQVHVQVDPYGVTVATFVVYNMAGVKCYDLSLPLFDLILKCK